jgi:hypothetical protein
MKDILDYFSTWSALKWIILVLIAGFIGQFGKILAQTIIRKIQLARLKRQNPSVIEIPPTEDYSVLSDSSEQRAQSPAQDARSDKKALKILAKQSKKEAKKNKKGSALQGPVSIFIKMF